jgi:NADH-quinone oxidoreductase subunit E
MAKELSEFKVRDFGGESADLVPALQQVQEADGYISPEAVRGLSRQLKVSENEVFGVATFYAQFRFNPPGKHHIKACLGTACHVSGGEQLLDILQRELKIKPGETTEDGQYDLERVACLGCCALAPVVTVDERAHGQMSVKKVQRLLDENKKD